MNYLIKPSGDTEKYVWSFNELINMVCEHYGVAECKWYEGDATKACVLTTEGDLNTSLQEFLVNADIFDWISVSAWQEEAELETALCEQGLTTTPTTPTGTFKLLNIVDSKVIMVSTYMDRKSATDLLTKAYNETMEYISEQDQQVVHQIFEPASSKQFAGIISQDTDDVTTIYEWQIVDSTFVDWCNAHAPSDFQKLDENDFYTKMLPQYFSAHPESTRITVPVTQERKELCDCKLLGVVNDQVVSVSDWHTRQAAWHLLSESFNEMLRYAGAANHSITNTMEPVESGQYAAVVLRNCTTGELDEHEWWIVGKDFVNWVESRPCDMFKDATPAEVYTAVLPLYAKCHRPAEF